MPSIKETLEKIKPAYPILLLAVVSAIFFGLGRLSAIKRGQEGIKIEYASADQTGSVIGAGVSSSTSSIGNAKPSSQIQSPAVVSSGEVIGSKSGKKYYFPWCGTVKRIKPENQVHFASIEEAKAAGFTPGGNCKGLQ